MGFRLFISILFAALMLVSCNESKTKGPNSTGRGSEIIVVCNRSVWTGPSGDTIRAALMRNLYGLPEPETEFTLINIPEKDFTKFLQSHHNVLIVDIKAGYGKSKVETLSNVWSQPQRVVKIKAGSDTAFYNIFNKRQSAISELFEQNERASFSARNALRRNFDIEKLLAEEFGINMVISNDFYKAKKTNDFILLRSETTTMSLGLVVYIYPFKDTAQLNPVAVLAARDHYAQLYVPGPIEGSYMTVERDTTPPASHKLLFKGLYAIETKGLWKTKDNIMSGPFINYTIIDAPRRRIVVLDGYVYSPNKSKRNYIRQLESIIWGAEFSDPMKVEPKPKS